MRLGDWVKVILMGSSLCLYLLFLFVGCYNEYKALSRTCLKSEVRRICTPSADINSIKLDCRVAEVCTQWKTESEGR